MSKLRIICLHGFTSNGAVHAHQVKRITSKLSKDFEFIFPDGPHEVDIQKSMGNGPTTRAWSEYVAQNSKSSHRAWWFAKDPDAAKNEPGGFKGLETSLHHIGTIMKETGPVHAIWGFSQGAAFAGILMCLLHEKANENLLRQLLPKSQGLPSAGIFFSGFRARFEQYDSVYESGIQVPTLHILGKKDNIVDLERSRSLIKVCHNPQILVHLAGHEIPGKEDDQQAIVDFLQNISKVEKATD